MRKTVLKFLSDIENWNLIARIAEYRAEGAEVPELLTSDISKRIERELNPPTTRNFKKFFRLCMTHFHLTVNEMRKRGKI